MASILIGIGLALIVFGAFILVRHSDRPGGTIKWLGLEVSSSGAGLPLIALGIGSVLVATMTQQNDPDGGVTELPNAESTVSDPPSSYSSASAGNGYVPNAFADSSSCLSSLFSSVPSDRVKFVESGISD